ncbi:MAG: EamA family transporter [Clostridiales bacterium]|nr:EamA family transporter [Eubacteriales bacterium]MDH7565176.1 EamA family transporter [Clostridiales bacterium]
MVFFLAIFGMVCWGIAPIFAKLALKNVNSVTGLTIRTLFAACMIILWTLFSGNSINFKAITLNTWVFIGIEALLATLVGDLAYYAAIKRGEVSLVTIIMSSSPLVTIMFAAIFLNEPITLLRVIGAVLVILGIALSL